MIFLFSFCIFGISAQDCGTNNDVSFKGQHQNTLCETIGEGPFQNFVQIGEGTAFPKASDINFTPTKLHIVSDFTIDVNFTFQDDDVKINEGSNINMYGNRTLTINNSNLFACEGMWDGIIMNNGCTVTVENGTHIEDALTAINSSNKNSTSINISNTIFNRNDIGVFLSKNNNSNVSTPNFSIISNSDFTCDAPLNSGINDVSHAGIKSIGHTINCDIRYSLFNGLEYGILSENSTDDIITASITNFVDIFIDCINSKRGVVRLVSCNLVNFGVSGVLLFKATLLNVKNSIFRIDVPISNGQITNQQAIDVRSYNSESSILVKNSTFDFDTASGQNVSGIVLRTSSANYTTLSTIINNNDFLLNGFGHFGILINGNYSSTSTAQITQNDFEFGKYVDNGARSTGMLINSKISNLNIILNDFQSLASRGGPIHIKDRGIVLLGNFGAESAGFNNQVTSNYFDTDIYLKGFRPCIDVKSFDNLKLCDNFNYGSFSTVFFDGNMDNIDFTDNTSRGGQLIGILPGASIGEQSHRGNQFILTNGIINPTANCDPITVQFSRFKVHSPQSDPGIPYVSPFHPFYINPDANNEWWIQETGTPNVTCQSSNHSINRSEGINHAFYESVASGRLGDLFESEEYIWQANRKFIGLLRSSTEMLAYANNYQEFYSRNIDTDFYKLNEVETLLNEYLNDRSNESLLIDTQNMNESVQSLLLPSVYEKEINRILIAQFSNDDYSIYDSVDMLLTIASTCPKLAGQAVYEANRLLPRCYSIGIAADCEDSQGEVLMNNASDDLDYVDRSNKINVESSNAIHIYPNPANSFIAVSSKNKGVLYVYNIDGVIVREFKENTNFKVDMSNLGTGIYNFMLVLESGERINKKVVKTE